MKIAIGIDVGISTTKIVGIQDGGVTSPLWIKATDPVTSLYGAFGKFLHENDISLDNVSRVMLTGVGAAYINDSIYGLPTHHVEEFLADGLGAAYESRLNRMIVVSMGTGTSLVSYDKGEIRHIGGIGIGGGTLNGLSRLLLQTDDIKQIIQHRLFIGNAMAGHDIIQIDFIKEHYDIEHTLSLVRGRGNEIIAGPDGLKRPVIDEHTGE